MAPSEVADEGAKTWSDDDIDHMIVTIVQVLVVGFVTFVFVLRPMMARHYKAMEENMAAHNNNNNNNNNTGGTRTSATTTSSSSNGNGSGRSSSDDLVDGVRSFASRKLSPSAEGIQLLQSLACASNMPSIANSKRGATAVIAIDDLDNNKTVAAYLLNHIGSMTNLFVIVHCSTAKDAAAAAAAIKKTTQQIQGLYHDDKLDATIVPKHRVLTSSCATGRIAIVRQLKPEFVVDFDPSVQTQLKRFGFHVILYGKTNDITDNDNDNGSDSVDKTTDPHFDRFVDILPESCRRKLLEESSTQTQ